MQIPIQVRTWLPGDAVIPHIYKFCKSCGLPPTQSPRLAAARAGSQKEERDYLAVSSLTFHLDGKDTVKTDTNVQNRRRKR